MSQLPGYELDINTLIDTFAIQAHQQEDLSFQAFKQLFSNGCYAYIHQAYWGCEHSPEYAQLLFAVALDRLDIPSPTASPGSNLWQLHQLLPQGGLAAAHGASTRTGPAEQHMAAAAGGAEAMDIDQLQLLSGPDSFSAPAGQHSYVAEQPAAMQLDDHLEQQDWLQLPEQQLQQLEGQVGPSVQEQLPPEQQQQQQQNVQEAVRQPPVMAEPCQPSCSPQPARQGPPAWQQDHAQQQQQDGVWQQQQQQQRSQQQQHVNAQQFCEELLSSPLLLPHQMPHQTPQQLGQPGMQLSPDDPLWQLFPTPVRQQHQGTGDAAQPGLEGFMLPGPAIPPAGQPQQPQQPPQEQQDVQPAPGACTAANGVQLLPLQQQQRQHQLQQSQMQAEAGTPANEVQLQGQQQQQQQEPQGWQVQVEEEDAFLSDLLAIFDEAMQSQEQQGAAAAAADGAARTSGSAAPTAGPASPGAPQHQQQQYSLQIPLVVKGAAVFALLALHESQLIYPKVPVYVPLPLLQQFVAAAGEFRAAGAAAADALQAVQVLVQQDRLLVGQFRRPNKWEPQLPPYLMPGGRLPGGLGLNTAIGVAARKAARAAAKSSMQSAAVAAAARAARGAAGFDPGVQREAMFHIKSALRTLSNFRSLQSLCDEYASVRNAVFEPVLGTRIHHPTAAGEQQQPASADPQAQQQQQAGASKSSKQAAMVVMRGGSRRKAAKARKAAMAGAAAVPAGRPGGPSQGSPAAASTGAGAVAARQEQAAGQASPTTSSPAAGGVGLPELFDTGFAASLQGLANSEAARMLLLLDPYYNASKVRKRTAEEKRAAKAADEAAAAAARDRLSRFKRLTLGRAGAHGAAGGQHGPAAGQHRQQQPSRSAPAGMQGIQQELLAAGVFSEHELQDATGSLADLGGDLRSGAQQVLRRAAQQRQTAVQVAQEWLRAQSALVLVDADDEEDGDDDMP